MDPAGGGCMGRPGWDVWWHEQQFVSYVNEPDSDPCTLTLNQSGDVLYGTFECAPLSMGPDDIEVRNGSFSCEIEAQD